MARIISSVTHPDAIANRGERLVFQAFREALGKHFLVFYSLPFIREHRTGHNLVDGENDFVLLDQQRGTLLVLEVKAGEVRSQVEGDQRVWYQAGHRMDAGPWEQVAGNKYSLVEWLCRRLGCEPHAFPLSHGHAVLLPDVHAPVDGPLPDITPEVTITWTDAAGLAARIEACSAAWQMKGHREPSAAVIDRVRRLLMPDFIYGNTLCDRIGVERRDAGGVPAGHDCLLEFIGNRRRARIAGCAGAGKTMLAVAKARQLARDGARVLFLVYNQALCGHLRRHLADAPGVSVQVFHEFCRQRCGADWPETPPADAGFWWGSVPELLDRALAGRPVEYDALLVDEAQDFQCAAWLVLERVVKPDGWYYIFYDKEQNIFHGDLQWPVQEAPFLLLRHLRGTRAILGALESRTGIRLLPGGILPEGVPVREETGATCAQRRRLAGKVLHEWIRGEGLSENQVVILGAHAQAHTSLEDTGRAGSFHIAERVDPAPGVVPYYTYMAFKGCESDAVILLDVDPADPRWDTPGLYAAMTRARHLLAIIGPGP